MRIRTRHLLGVTERRIHVRGCHGLAQIRASRSEVCGETEVEAEEGRARLVMRIVVVAKTLVAHYVTPTSRKPATTVSACQQYERLNTDRLQKTKAWRTCDYGQYFFSSLPES
jgi:hypothetical protein